MEWPRKKRVLFITAGSIGDAVMTSGLLHRFVEWEPEAGFTIVAGPQAAPLFLDTPRLDNLIALRKKRFSLHWLDLWRQVKDYSWTAVIDMRGSGLAYALWAKRRLVYRRRRRQHDLGPLHKVLEASGVVGSPDLALAPFLYASAKTQARADELIGRRGPILAIAPSSNFRPKTWPADRFAQAALELLDTPGPLQGGRVLLTGGRGDVSACEPIRAALPPERLIDLVGLDLLTTYAAFRRIRLFIGNDLGLMHLSAASGAPTLGLFGPSDERRYRPWGPRAAVVREGKEFIECEAAIKAGGYEASYMTDLRVATVVLTARRLMENTRDMGFDDLATPVAV